MHTEASTRMDESFISDKTDSKQSVKITTKAESSVKAQQKAIQSRKNESKKPKHRFETGYVTSTVTVSKERPKIVREFTIRNKNDVILEGCKMS